MKQDHTFFWMGASTAHRQPRFTNVEFTMIVSKPELAKKVENEILSFLITSEDMDRTNGRRVRVNGDSEYPGETRLTMYFAICRRLDIEITSRFFNEVITDMKKVGLLKTAKDGEQVFLSSAAEQQLSSQIKEAAESWRKTFSETMEEIKKDRESKQQGGVR